MLRAAAAATQLLPVSAAVKAEADEEFPIRPFIKIRPDEIGQFASLCRRTTLWVVAVSTVSAIKCHLLF